MPLKNIDYVKIKEREKVLVLKSNQSVRVKFLDNGKVQDDYELIDDEGNTKKVNKYIYKVQDLDDDNKEKELSFLAITFVDSIEPLLPIKDKEFSIRKNQQNPNDKFNINFTITTLK